MSDIQNETMDQRALRLGREKNVRDGHGSLFNPGEKYGRWTLDKDHWWYRPRGPRDGVLVAQRSNYAFTTASKVYVRSKAIAARLDRGLKIS
jgi:hypothetical protein